MKSAAIIGISNYARHHLLMALEQNLHGRLRLRAATVINQSQEAFFCERLRQLGCEIFASADAMWDRYAGEINLCFIPTGIHLHAAMTLQALRSGANVLVEKPLAASIEDAQQIIDFERETGRFVAVGFQDLYTDSTWAIKRLLLDGGIGKLSEISFVGMWPRPAAYYTRNEWAGRLQRNGQVVLDSPINNAFAHFLNLALFWAGRTLKTSSTVEQVECELYRAHSIESFDTCCIRAHLDTGVELHAHATHSCREERVPRLRLQGTDGTLEWVQESHYDVVRLDGSTERKPVAGKFETKLMMADAVVARCDNPAVRICTTGMAIEHMRLVQELHASSPISEIPANFVRLSHTPTGEWREIVGIEPAIEEATRKKMLWSELDLPWARRSAPSPQGTYAMRNGAK